MRVSDVSINTENGKKLVYFMGAYFCPYCASERWAIREALKIFGDWKNSEYDKSAESDEKYLNVPTISFHKSNYSSKYVEFQSMETADRYFNPINQEQEDSYDVLENYNPDQIIPFLLIDGQFMQVGSGINAKIIEGMDHKDVEKELSIADSKIGSEIRKESEYITALICWSLKNDLNLCKNDAIKKLQENI